ncbi:MAG: flagellar protein FlaG [Treponema sp.]|jgi:flagellar protein FlaG|nr:flagellar protein FlaG [Treponema sp.]
MNTISSFGQTLAMDGLNLNSSAVTPAKSISTQKNSTVNTLKTPTGSEVVDNLVQSMAEIKADAQQMQNMSARIMGRELQFNVNKELGSIVVKVVDPSTDQVVKEIPSEEIQNLKIRIRKAIGVLFDQIV